MDLWHARGDLSVPETEQAALDLAVQMSRNENNCNKNNYSSSGKSNPSNNNNANNNGDNDYYHNDNNNDKDSQFSWQDDLETCLTMSLQYDRQSDREKNNGHASGELIRGIHGQINGGINSEIHGVMSGGMDRGMKRQTETGGGGGGSDVGSGTADNRDLPSLPAAPEGLNMGGNMGNMGVHIGGGDGAVDGALIAMQGDILRSVAAESEREHYERVREISEREHLDLCVSEVRISIPLSSLFSPHSSLPNFLFLSRLCSPFSLLLSLLLSLLYLSSSFVIH